MMKRKKVNKITEGWRKRGRDSFFVHFMERDIASITRLTSIFRKTTYTSVTLLSLLTLAILCPVYLVPDSIKATTKDANPSTLTYTSTSSAASVSLTVSDTAGTFATSNSGELASFSLTTNNATGYTLNLKTSGDTTSLSDGTNNIATISSATTSSNFSNNTWGLLPSKYNGTANTGDNPNYYPASTSGFKMDETSVANTTANTYTVGLGLKVNHNTPAGTYTNSTIIAEYVANAVTYSINYYTNTTDTVTGMPSINPQTGTVAQGTTSTSVNLASAPTRTGYTFKGWCKGTNASTSNITVKTDGTPDVCSTTTYDAGQSFGIDATVSPDAYYLFAMWQRISFTITRQYKLQDTSGNYPSTYTADTDATVLYGDSYTYTIAATTSHQVASTTINNVTSNQTVSLNVPRKTVTCNTQYRLEKADGTWENYQSDTATSAYYGGSCSYSKTVTDYKGTSGGANGSQGSTSASNVTSTQTLSLSFYRNTYTLTVTASTNTSSASGGGSKRWGQTVQVSVNKSANVTCTTYAAPSWSQGSASGTIGTTSNSGNTYYMNYTMPKSAATVTATSTASSVNQTITFKTSNATTITFNGTNKSNNDTASVACGTYNLVAAAFPTGYEFSSWSNTAGTIASTSSSSTTFTVNGPATITLNGKKKTFSLKVNFAGTGVSSVQVRTASGTGGTLKGTVSSSGGSVSGLEYNTAYYLYPSFSSGYEFSAWAKNSSAGTLSSTSSSNPTFTMGNGAGEVTITGKASCSTTTFSGYMQNMTASTVANACVGTTGTLTDRRDNKTYKVAKLADGNLWMTENLAIDLTVTSYDTLYGTGSNAGKQTNATSEALGYLKGTTTGTSSDQWATAAVRKNWTSSYSYSVPLIAVDSSTSGVCDTPTTWCVDLTGNGAWSWDTVTPATINGKTSIAQGKLGVYYNYCAASAGSYCWGDGKSYTGSPSSDPNTSSLRDITSDICPYGWRLPTTTSGGEFKALYDAYSNGTNFVTALSTPLSGTFYSGKAYNQGDYGLLWSSTWDRSYRMYAVFVSATGANLVNQLTRYEGLTVRCMFGS